MESVPCNLCGNTNYERVYLAHDWQFDQSEVQASIVRCSECGLLYQNPRPDSTEMSKYYPPDYDLYHVDQKIKKSSWLMRRAMQYGIDKRCRMVTREKSAGALLDLGCATGVFLTNMRRFPGWEVYGVEPSEYAVQVARETHGLNVFCGSLEEAAFQENQFDVVTLWDVLEHLPDPDASLRELHRILKPGGILVLRVPNIESWDARIFGQYWAGLEPPRHYYIFSPRTLGQLLAKNGFEVKHMGCEIGSYPTFVLSLTFWMTGRAWSPQLRNLVSKVFYHPIARIVSAPVFYLAGLGKKGPLLLAVVSRR